MSKLKSFIIPIILLFIPLYPKFPLLGVSDTFVSIRLEDILVGLILFVYGLILLKRKFIPLNKPVSRAIILYWLAGAVATFSGIFLTKTATLNLGILHMLRRVEYMSLFLVAYELLENTTQLKFYVRTLFVVSLIVAVYGLGQQFLGFPIISTTNSEFAKGLALSLGPGARINSTFAGHYDLAAFCILPLLLIIALLPHVKQKVLLFILGLGIYWALLLSASRISFASFFISSCLLVVFMRRKFWLVPLIGLSVLGFLLAPQLRGRYLDLLTTKFKLSLVSSVQAQETSSPSSKAVDQVPDALKPAAVPEDRSFSIRLNAEWPRALRSFVKNPVLGTGFSSIGLAADNEYLRSLAETGALGLAAFGLIFYITFKSSLPLLLHYHPSFKNAFIVAVTCYSISLLLGAMFIDVFEASKIAMVTWTIIGLAEKAKTLST